MYHKYWTGYQHAHSSWWKRLNAHDLCHDAIQVFLMFVDCRAEVRTEWEAKSADEGFVTDDNGNRWCHGNRERPDHTKLETRSHLGHLMPLLVWSCIPIKKLVVRYACNSPSISNVWCIKARRSFFIQSSLKCFSVHVQCIEMRPKERSLFTCE